jgi:hypothetical protein
MSIRKLLVSIFMLACGLLAACQTQVPVATIEAPWI